jgi:hypothetical protein
MRRIVLSLILVASAAACGLPPNQPVVTGTAAYDWRTGDFWVNGDPYVLPPDVATWHVQNGDEVAVYYRVEGEQRVVTRMEIRSRLINRMR